MLGYLTVIFCCQLAGELLVASLGLPIPGPVAGMLLLMIGLVVRGSIPNELGDVGDFLLGHLSLLFVPAGVGVMLHVNLLGRDWVPLTIALVASTVLTVVVTALVMQWLSRSGSSDKIHG